VSSSGQALVTGGAGFVGSHLAAGLLAQGMRVRVLDDLSTGREHNLAGFTVELVQGDVRDARALAEAMQGVRWVFHEAAMVSVPASLDDPLSCYEVNLQGTLQVLWAAYQAGVQRVVVASSAAVYGEATEPVDEESPKRPLSPYAASKLAMEGAARLFTRVYGLATVCLRYFNAYGPRQRPDSPYAAVIPSFIEAMLEGRPATIHGEGDQSRDFVYIGDVVRANLLAAERPEAVGGVFNIGSGVSVTIRELAGILQSFFPQAPAPLHGPSREGDIRFSRAVLDRAAQALGYRPEVGMQEGLRSTVEWFRQERPTPAP
jgi:UDP-glucose 4-epimerase